MPRPTRRCRRPARDRAGRTADGLPARRARPSSPERALAADAPPRIGPTNEPERHHQHRAGLHQPGGARRDAEVAADGLQQRRVGRQRGTEVDGEREHAEQHDGRTDPRRRGRHRVAVARRRRHPGRGAGPPPDPLVRRRHRHPHVALSRRPVELPGRHEDPQLGEPPHRRASGLARRRPQVEPGLGVLDLEAPRLERHPQLRPAPGVGLRLGDDVRVVRRRGRHRGLHRPRHHHPGVLADLEQAPRPPQGRRSRNRRGTPRGSTTCSSSAPRAGRCGRRRRRPGAGSTAAPVRRRAPGSTRRTPRPRPAPAPRRRPCAGARPAAPGPSGWTVSSARSATGAGRAR